MKKLHNYLSNISFPKFCVIATIPQLILTLLILYLGNNIVPIHGNFSNDSTNNMTTFTMIASTVVIGPFIETLIFQSCVIGLFFSFSTSRTRRIKVISIICSGLIFGLLHFFSTLTSGLIWSILYGIKSAVLGIILGYSYILYYDKTNSYKKAVLAVYFIHALNNLLAVLISYIM